MKDYVNKIILTLAFLSLPFAASANMIWPSIFIVKSYYTWYVIVAGLLIETVAARRFLGTDWLKSLLMMTVANAISAITGWILIPVSGLIVEVLLLPFGGGTFNLFHWISDYLCAVLINSCIEGLILKWIYKYPFKPNFRWLFVANLISVVICFILMLIK